jgi:site-specific DNA recombinase
MSISSERLARADAIELISDSTGPGVAALRSEVISLRSRLQRIAVEFADDDTVTPAQFRAITSRLRTRLDALEAHIADAGRVSVLGPFITAASEDRQAAIERVRGVWDAMLEQGTDRCRAVIDTLMTITLHSPGPGARRFDPATIEIVPKEQW